ncbi:CoB--CoM heterodisulfide reductase iron-sulfur subunit B family protein [Desulfoluna spongiiphila]|uniref:Heterodisulfide reductase subunit B n=1 Tax=Desulfoluna spongiiphila TaxID=419481 RepID=A0A1G5EZJ6_9BACT|nr:CoB--CoM heterodisulfide reductase iron-sulfur subunit B family protein [Desulfoluna spongiiphila]SCY32445.1 heterodisulfide reductase subunit B [Desulfoluna spongiiphila]
MGYVLFSGCTIPSRLPGYRDATMAVLDAFGVDHVDGDGFNCCGYPLRNTDREIYLLSSARNLALAEKAGRDILVMCKCCYGSFKHAQNALNQDLQLRDEVNAILRREGLVYRGVVRVTHILSFLRHGVGLAAIRQRAVSPHAGVRAGVQYGCHMLRPSNINEINETGVPAFFDLLLSAIGMESLDYSRKFDCCGAPLNGINSVLSKKMTVAKLRAIREAGGSLVVTGCPYCHLQFAGVVEDGDGLPRPVVYPQLLGLAMGLPVETLGIGPAEAEVLGLTRVVNCATMGLSQPVHAGQHPGR